MQLEVPVAQLSHMGFFELNLAAVVPSKRTCSVKKTRADRRVLQNVGYAICLEHMGFFQPLDGVFSTPGWGLFNPGKGFFRPSDGVFSTLYPCLSSVSVATVRKIAVFSRRQVQASVRLVRKFKY